MQLEVLPILKIAGLASKVLVLSRWCSSRRTHVIELPSVGVERQNQAWDEACKLVEASTGFSPAAFRRGASLGDQGSRFSFETVEIVRNEATSNRNVSGGTLGKDDAMLEVPLAGFGEALKTLRSEGREIDVKLLYLAQGIETAIGSPATQAYAMHGAAKSLGLIWLAAATVYGGAVICNGLGMDINLKLPKSS